VAIYPSQLPAPVRRAFWKLAYQAMARTWDRADWRLMNYGYEPAEGERNVVDMPELKGDDETDRYCIQLYHRVAGQRDLTGLDVLEVGSGRGGGASYVHRYLGPKKTVGLDRSPAAVELASRREGTAGLQYIVGDAEALPLEDGQFDVVLNVESCHCYGSVPKFLEEVHRVLRPGGSLLITDLRLAPKQAAFDAELEASPFEMVRRSDITAGVVRGLVKDTPRRNQMVSETAGRWSSLMTWFSGVQGSATFRDLDDRTLVYHCYELRKAGGVAAAR